MEITRIRKEEVPVRQRWAASAVSELEKRRIVKWIEGQARLNLQKKNATRASALESSNVVAKEIGGLFAVREENRDLGLIEDAATGRVGRSAPSLALLRAYNVLRWVLMGLEICVFAGLVIFQGAAAAVLISGGILAVSGFALGHGVGRLVASDDSRREKVLPKIWIVVGIVGIIGVAYMRASYGGEGALNVTLITLAIALLIAVVEAAFQSSRERYFRAWDDMFAAQVWIATSRNEADQESGFWKEKYEDEVRRLENAVREVERIENKGGE